MQQLRVDSILFSVPPTTAVALLHFWVIQPGFPLINISASGTQATQSRFYAWGGVVADDPFVVNGNSTWYVPLGAGQLDPPAASGDANTEWRELLDHTGLIPDTGADGMVMNVGGTGYYRCVTPYVLSPSSNP